MTRSIANDYGIHENTLYKCKLQFDQHGESLFIMNTTRWTRRSRPLEALGQRIGTGVLKSSGILCKSPQWSMLGLIRTRFPGCPCALCACCYSCGVIATTSTTSGERPSASTGRVYKYYKFKMRFMRTIGFMAHGPMSQNLQGKGFVSTVNESGTLSNRKVRFLWCTGSESTQRIPITIQVSSLILSRQEQPLRGLSYPMPW